MGIHVKAERPIDAAFPVRTGEGVPHGGGYQPARWSPLSLTLAMVIPAMPLIVGLWVWQPALVQLAPSASLAVFDVPVPEAPAPEQPPEPDEEMEAPRDTPAPVAMPVVERPAPAPPVVVIPSAQATPTSPPPPAAKAAPPRSASSAPSEKPADWQSRVLARLNAVKTYPSSARARRQQGVVMIRFTLNRQGGVVDVGLAQSSGFALLDREALALPRRAAPLPVPPKDVTGERIELLVPVEFFF